MPLDPPADLRLPSIEALRAFELAARLGTFERAAEALSLTASAIGKRIATLEDLLGTPLFERAGNRLALTVAGREYLEQVRAALGLLAAVPLHRRGAQRRERLRVTAPPTFARQILVPQLDGFTQAEPEIELEVVLSIPFLGSAEETPAADATPGTGIEIVHGTPRGQGEVLMHDLLLPVAAPSLLERRGRPRRPAELRALPLLRTPIEPWQPWFQAAGLDWPEPAEGPRLVDLGLTLEAAVCGQGVALARPTLALHWLEAGALQAPFDLTTPAPRQYLLRPHAAEGPAARFAAWLRSVCEARGRAVAEWFSARA